MVKMILKAKILKPGVITFTSEDGTYRRDCAMNKGLEIWMGGDREARFEAMVHEPNGKICSLFRIDRRH